MAKVTITIEDKGADQVGVAVDFGDPTPVDEATPAHELALAALDAISRFTTGAQGTEGEAMRQEAG